MADPSPEHRLAPLPSPEVIEERFRIWKDLMDTCEQLLLAGLRHKIGPDGDLNQAYREWIIQDNERRSREKYARYKSKDQ